MPVTINGSTGISSPDGSAGTPSYKGTSGATNGLYFPSATTCALATNGTSALYIDASGNVGIGTSSPSYRLHVYNSSGNGQIGLNYGSSNTGLIEGFSAGLNLCALGASTYMAFATGGTSVSEKMRIDSSGNIGIGTTSPTSTRLDCYASAANSSALRLSNPSNTSSYVELTFGANSLSTSLGYSSFIRGYSFVSGDYSGYLTFGTSATTPSAAPVERARIDSSGNFYLETGQLWQYSPAPTSIAAVTTLTVAQLQNDIINTTGTSYTVTLPTGTAIDAGFTGVPTTNIAFDFHIVNTASGTITMAVNTNVTSVGTLTVATGVSATFRLRRTAANTYVLYRIN